MTIGDIITAAIAEYRQHLARFANRSSLFMIGLERADYEKTVRDAVLVALPRLYALNYDDQTDLPPEIYRAVETIEHDLGMNLEYEYEDA